MARPSPSAPIESVVRLSAAEINALGPEIARLVSQVYAEQRPLPRERSDLPPVPEQGIGTHVPDLNIQTLRFSRPDPDGELTRQAQNRLTERGRTWLSTTRWQNQTLLRAVLLSPAITAEHLQSFVEDIIDAG